MKYLNRHEWDEQPVISLQFTQKQLSEICDKAHIYIQFGKTALCDEKIISDKFAKKNNKRSMCQ